VIEQPVYYFISYLFFKIFIPNSKFIIRFPAFVFGTLSIWLIYNSFKRLFNRNVAFVSSVLLAFNFFQLRYSTEARTYSLNIFLSIISIYYFCRFIQQEGRMKSVKIALLTVNSLMFLAHSLLIFFIACEYIILFIHVYFYETKQPLNIKLLSKIIIRKFKWEALIFAIIFALRIKEIAIPGYEWILSPKLKDLWGLYIYLLQYTYFLPRLLILVIVLLILLGALLRKKQFANTIISFYQGNRYLVYFILVVIFLVPILFFTISQFKPIFLGRYLSFILVPLILFISILLSAISPAVKNIIIMLIISLSLLSISENRSFNRFNLPYDAIFNYLAHIKDKVIFSSYDANVIIDYYKRRNGYDYANIIPAQKKIDPNINYDGYILFNEFWSIDPSRIRIWDVINKNNNYRLEAINFPDFGRKFTARKIRCKGEDNPIE
jgi:uncharacterized membrane protein